MSSNVNEHRLTGHQEKVLSFILWQLDRTGFAPSLSEIAEEFGHGIPTAQHYVRELEKKGYIRRGMHKTRGILPDTDMVDSVPKLGLITAGEPIEPIEEPESVSVPKTMVSKPGQYYALEVAGDSMVEDGIRSGDLILIKNQFTAKDGNTVVAIMNESGEATLKTFKQGARYPYLQPQNEKHNIITNPFTIRGIMVGLIRQNA